MITHYIILLDTSYSMNDKIEKIIFSLNNYVMSKKNHNDIYFSIAYFNNEMRFLKKIENVNNLNPILISDLKYFGGMTSLHDSVCEIIYEFLPITNESVHHNFFIITDGDDTSSKKYNENEMENLCNQCIKSGNWTIIHFHTHDIESLFNVSSEIEINNDNLENIFANLKI